MKTLLLPAARAAPVPFGLQSAFNIAKGRAASTA